MNALPYDAIMGSSSIQTGKIYEAPADGTRGDHMVEVTIIFYDDMEPRRGRYGFVLLIGKLLLAVLVVASSRMLDENVDESSIYCFFWKLHNAETLSKSSKSSIVSQIINACSIMARTFPWSSLCRWPCP